MAILRFNILGSPNVGVFTLATDSYTLVPIGVTPTKVMRISKALKTAVLNVDIGYCKLVGVLSTANSNGIVLPYYTTEEEAGFLRKNLDIRVGSIESNKTSFGNMILANDKGALASPILTRTEIKAIEDILQVEVSRGSLAGFQLVGSVAVASNKGILAHPKASESEKENLASLLKVPVMTGTVNGGGLYIRSGLVINSQGALVGSLTTGPELMTLSSIL